MLELTQKGHDRALEELGGEAPARSGTAGITLYAALAFLRDLADRTGTSPRDLFRFRLATPLSADTPADGPADLDERIRKAYSALARQPGDYVSLADLRETLADVGRGDVDVALIQLNRATDVSLVPESNQKVLTDPERAAAVSIGNQLKHLIAIRA
jgi:hypothetical protein